MPLDPPPRDEAGNVVVHDHAGIAASDGVIRRISDRQIVVDKITGGRRLSSAAFKASHGKGSGMSVDLLREIEHTGLDARTYVTTPRWIGSVKFDAGALRAEGFSVGYDPLPDKPHHGEVWGRVSGAQQKRLAELCEWFVQIPGVAKDQIS